MSFTRFCLIIDFIKQSGGPFFFLMDNVIDRLQQQNQYKHVALQFPDFMLNESTSIVNRLKPFCQPFVLGDTTFGSCCVDVIAASHLPCDLLIHFGPACLSVPNCPWPVWFVFEEKQLDLEAVASSLASFKKKTLVYYDVCYHYCIDKLKEMVKSQNLIWSSIDPFNCCGRKIPKQQESDLNLVYIGEMDMTCTNLTLSNPGIDAYYFSGELTRSKKIL